MSDIERAIGLAVEAHRGQKDRNARPYILHPLTLMMKMDTEVEMMTGVLHDVVEDTDWTLDRLKAEGFPPEVVEAVDALSKREGESYDDYIERLSRNPLAVKVKVADLVDNMRLTRMNEVTEQDASRLARYLRAWKKLKGTGSP